MRETSYKLVDLSATIFIAWGALGAFADVYSRYRHSAPLDIAVVVGNAGITAARLVAAAVTRSLRKIEDRLRQLEQRREANNVRSDLD